MWVVGIPLLFGVVAAIRCDPTLDPSGIFLSIGIVLLAMVLGYFASILVGWFVLGPLYYGRSRKNGEPFREGDMVQILVGPHRDRVARVYRALDIASWAGAHRVYVELGEDEKAAGRDVFKSYEIVRVA